MRVKENWREKMVKQLGIEKGFKPLDINPWKNVNEG